ncbi:hypothetical protein WJX81_005860 [Elliptochloris bilobata]|uniref:Uncharacterized protein n=1 Tax=Elliptochloris bilobata TaxID=381761 RepID=A0AAW1QIV6_9CHLO
MRSTPIAPNRTQRRTLAEVNANPPTYTDPSSGLSVRPVAASSLTSAVPSPAIAGGASVAAANTDTLAASQDGAVASADPYSGVDGLKNPGSYVSSVLGVRVSTPLFGTGFNACIDRYFGSFPKVGVVVPSPAAWLLPEFQDLSSQLTTTLDLPAVMPHGLTAEPTGDGFLIWLPSIQPSSLPNFAMRYGIQIGQVFGYEFGYGMIKDICFINFVLV